MTTETPLFFDSVNNVFRPMDSGATIPTTTLPVSATLGNTVQVLSDGLYVGDYNGLVLYVNTSSGSDSNAGTKLAPFQTLNHCLSYMNSLFPGGQFTGNMTIAMAAGQTYPWPTTDFQTYAGANLLITFYGDPNYGDFNSAFVAGTTNPAYMSNLERPIITPPSYTDTSGQYQLYGINRNGGTITLSGVQVNLPAAPVSPGITNYGGFCDFIRNTSGTESGSISLLGSVVNMTDVTAFWGFMGSLSRSFTRFNQFASQFQINGIVMSAANNPSSAQLAQRQYFIKFLEDYAGNNQNAVWLSTTGANSSNGSGGVQCSWSDTEALVVTGSTTNLASFPQSFLPGYGLINYIYNLTTTSNGQPLNFLNSRLM
jgi:hypothetical protein